MSPEARKATLGTTCFLLVIALFYGWIWSLKYEIGRWLSLGALVVIILVVVWVTIYNRAKRKNEGPEWDDRGYW